MTTARSSDLAALPEVQIYSGPAGNGLLVVSARSAAAGTPQAQWLVQFTRYGARRKLLDQCATWLPSLHVWDRFRWHPIGHRLIPLPILAIVEAWLRDREVEA
jgi:hypothetical protein